MLCILLEKLVPFFLKLFETFLIDFLFGFELLGKDSGFRVEILVQSDEFGVFFWEFLAGFGESCDECVFLPYNFTVELRLLLEVDKLFLIDVLRPFHVFDILKTVLQVNFQRINLLLERNFIKQQSTVNLCLFLDFFLHLVYNDSVLTFFIFQELNLSHIRHVFFVEVLLVCEQLIQLSDLVSDCCVKFLVLLKLFLVLGFELLVGGFGEWKHDFAVFELNLKLGDLAWFLFDYVKQVLLRWLQLNFTILEACPHLLVLFQQLIHLRVVSLLLLQLIRSPTQLFFHNQIVINQFFILLLQILNLLHFFVIILVKSVVLGR